MTLFEAVCEFEAILPKKPNRSSIFYDTATFSYNTWEDEKFGQLHRVFWDETNANKENPILIELLQPFIRSPKIVFDDDSEIVEDLRLFIFAENKRLEKERKKMKFRSIDEESSYWC